MNYYDRIQQSIEYIEEHLCDNLTLEELAETASLSKYYYHRMFSMLVGESVMTYIRKRRLGRATKQLDNTDLRIIDIAYDNGFESQEVFTRAFKRHFGLTPNKYRHLRERINMTEKVSILGTQDKKESYGIQPKIIVQEAMTVVGIVYRTCHEDILNNSIADLHTKIFYKRMNEIKGRTDNKMVYGICEDDYETDEVIHTACVEVKEPYSVPEGMMVRHLPYSRYLVFTHKGTPASMVETYSYIYKEFLQNSSYELSKTSTDLQKYLAQNPNTLGDYIEVDVCIPII